MKKFVCAVAVALILGASAGLAPPTMAQENQPAVIFEGLLDSYFGENDGFVALGSYDVVFAPDGQVNAVVGIVNANGDVLAQFPFFPDYELREGVFGRIQVVGPADIQLTEPGLYTMVFVLNDQPISRFPFLLEQTGDGSDPFDPQQTYVFDGYWRTMGHITMGSFDDQPIPVFSVWLGSIDMPTPDTFQAFFEADLYRDGTLIAHAKKQTSSYGAGHFGRQEVLLYQPHDEQQAPNAIALTMAELLVDGAYELRVTRAEDGAALRGFKFTVAGGEIVPLPQTVLGFEPATDYVAPRVIRKGSTGYEFEEAIWIGSE